MTDAEWEIIRAAFQAKRSAIGLAKELGCTSRCIFKWYEKLRINPAYKRRLVGQTKPLAKSTKTTPMLADRFYHSAFEPS